MGQAGVVVDGGMDEVAGHPLALASAVTVDAMADARQVLDIQVQEVSGPGVLVAYSRLPWFGFGQLTQTPAAQPAPQRAGRQRHRLAVGPFREPVIPVQPTGLLQTVYRTAADDCCGPPEHRSHPPH